MNVMKGLEGKPCKGVIEVSWLVQPGEEETEDRAGHELQPLHEGIGGTAPVSAACDQGKDLSQALGLCQGMIRVNIRERFFTFTGAGSQGGGYSTRPAFGQHCQAKGGIVLCRTSRSRA